MKTAQARLENNPASFDDREAYGERFRKASDFEIQEWIKSEEPSIALQAQWEEVNRTAIQPEGSDAATPQPERLEAFLERLEEISGTPIPAWWRQGFVNYCRDVGGIDGRYRHIKVRFRETELSERIRHPNESRLKQRGDNVYYLLDSGEVRIPEDLSRGLDRGISGVVHDSGYYLFAYEGLRHCDKVVCVDRKTGQERWRSDSCGCYWGGIEGLVGPAAGELAASDETVVAYYLGGMGAYVHGFRRKDGKTTFMFSTGF